MKKNAVKILVLIPVYNAEKYLRKCLDSVILQKHRNWEAYIIDDASDDNSYQILTEYAHCDKRVNVFRNEHNKGPGITRNICLNKASSNSSSELGAIEYIVFIDSDDWIEDTYFQSIFDIASSQNPDLIFVDLVQEYVSGKLVKYERMSAYKYKAKETIIRHQMTGKLPWGGVRKVVRKDLLVDNKINYSDDPIGEEALYSFKILFHSKKIQFIDKPIYHYVIHDDSQSRKRDEDPYGPISRKIESYLKDNNMYEEFRNTHISLMYTALIVSIYKKSGYYNFKSTLSQAKDALRDYDNTYGFDLDKNSLDIRTRCILPFARLKWAFPIVLLAKIKGLVGNK